MKITGLTPIWCRDNLSSLNEDAKPRHRTSTNAENRPLLQKPGWRDRTGIKLLSLYEDFLTENGLSLAVVLLLLLLSLGNSWAQSSNGYLQTLKSEAAGTRLDSRAEPVPEVAPRESVIVSPQGDAGQAGAIETLQAGLTLEQFQTVLKHNYIGSYLFFKRLTDQQKNEVFAFYQENPSPKKVREKILQVSKQ